MKKIMAYDVIDKLLRKQKNSYPAYRIFLETVWSDIRSKSDEEYKKIAIEKLKELGEMDIVKYFDYIAYSPDLIRM